MTFNQWAASEKGITKRQFKNLSWLAQNELRSEYVRNVFGCNQPPEQDVKNSVVGEAAKQATDSDTV